MVSFILRRLYHGTDIVDIKSALDTIAPGVVGKVTKFTKLQYFFDIGLFLVTLNLGKSLQDKVVTKVTKFTTPYSVKNSFDAGLLLVTLNLGKSLQDIARIKFLLSQSIQWEKSKRKEKEVQYHICQRWGHAAKNCNSEAQCVNCDIKHPPGECQRTYMKTIAPHCVNCDHPANRRGCPTYKKYIMSRKEHTRKVKEDEHSQK